MAWTVHFSSGKKKVTLLSLPLPLSGLCLLDGADCVCVNSAIPGRVYLYKAQLLDATFASIISWFCSTDSVISSPMLLPAAVKGVTAFAQIFTQTLPGLPVLHLSAAEMWSVRTHVLHDQFELL